MTGTRNPEESDASPEGQEDLASAPGAIARAVLQDVGYDSVGDALGVIGWVVFVLALAGGFVVGASGADAGLAVAVLVGGSIQGLLLVAVGRIVRFTKAAALLQAQTAVLMVSSVEALRGSTDAQHGPAPTPNGEEGAPRPTLS